MFFGTSANLQLPENSFGKLTLCVVNDSHHDLLANHLVIPALIVIYSTVIPA